MIRKMDIEGERTTRGKSDRSGAAGEKGKKEKGTKRLIDMD